MKIYKNDGEKVLTFLKENLGIELPKSGVLAGQSVCSVLLYLKGKKRDVHINDLDVFQMSPNHIDTIFVRNKCRPIYIGQIAAKRRENAYLFNTKKERDSFNKAIKYPERLKNKAKEAEVGVGLRQRLHLSPQERFEQITRQTEFSIEDVLDYAFIDRFIKPYSHCKTSLTEFTLERRFFAYEIDQVARRGLLNFVYVSGCQSIDKLTPNPNTILSGFDLNCCQVAIDLKNSQLYYTYPFVRFLESLQMEILCPSKPYQTMIRYFSKKEEFGFYGNDDLAIDLISTYKAIEEEVKKDESPLHNLHYGRYEDAGIPHNYKKFKIGRFGSRYAGKYRGLPSLKNSFGLITNELDFEPTKYGRKMFEKRGVDLPEKVLLSELEPRQAGSSYILAGKHREELEKRLGTPTRDYVYYCLSALPQIMKEHYRLSRGASVTNKWNSISSHLDKARTKRFRDEDLQIGFNNSAEEYANNYSPKTLSAISKLIAEHPCFVGAFRNVPHEIQISRLSFIKRLEKDDLELFYRAENCLGINWQTIDRSTYEAAKKHIKSVAYRERVKEDLLTNPDLEAEFLLDDCHVRQLTRRSELRKEGKEMGHCVGSYERRVKSKHSRIFAFVLKNGERATMETSGKNSPTAIRIIQFRGRFNGVVSKEMNTAGKEFLKMFKKGLKEKEQEDKEK